MRLSKTQIATLRYAAKHGSVSWQSYGCHARRQECDGPRGMKYRTIARLHVLGLLEMTLRSGRESVPAGAFGRTYVEGYRTRRYQEACATITEKGRAALAALDGGTAG